MNLPPCDHDNCPPTHCNMTNEELTRVNSELVTRIQELEKKVTVISRNKDAAEGLLATAMAQVKKLEQKLQQERDELRHPRIYSRCPACNNDTLCIHDKHLLCTWHVCPNPSLVDNLYQLATLSQTCLSCFHAQDAYLQAMNTKQPNAAELCLKADALRNKALKMAERIGLTPLT